MPFDARDPMSLSMLHLVARFQAGKAKTMKGGRARLYSQTWRMLNVGTTVALSSSSAETPGIRRGNGRGPTVISA